MDCGPFSNYFKTGKRYRKHSKYRIRRIPGYPPILPYPYRPIATVKSHPFPETTKSLHKPRRAARRTLPPNHIPLTFNFLYMSP